MEKSRLYTRTGDGGLTTAADGRRIPKTSACIEAYGTIDELNSCLGHLVSLLPPDSPDRAVLGHVQETLFSIGASLTDTASVTGLADEGGVEFLERLIDEEDGPLPKIRDFLVPGGSPCGSYAHVCRTVCRRAERRILAMSAEQPVPSESMRYINRLSDYLFVLSRKLNFIDNIIDNITEKSDDNTCR